MQNRLPAFTSIMAAAALSVPPAFADAEKVNAGTFIRADSDVYIANMAKEIGGLGTFAHSREVVPPDKQTIIRMNRDTLYSNAVVDLEGGPVTVTLPKADDGRSVALEVFSQDHFSTAVVDEGTHTFTKEDVGTRYAALLVRTFVDMNNPDDVKNAHAVKDAITLEQAAAGTLELPDHDKTSHHATRHALLDLGALGIGGLGAQMGSGPEKVDPVAHLIAAAAGWALNPPNGAIYLNPPLTTSDGTRVHQLVMKDVPVEAFWSIGVYNKDGFFEPNALNVNSVNSARPRAGDARLTAVGPPRRLGTARAGRAARQPEGAGGTSPAARIWRSCPDLWQPEH